MMNKILVALKITKKEFLPVWILLILPINLFAQDIYNFENSLKFAKYLHQTEQYEYAAQEFERVIFMEEKPNDTLVFLLINSYRKAGNYGEGKERFEKIYNQKFEKIPEILAHEYLKILLLQKKYNEAEFFLEQNKVLSTKTKNNYQLSIFLQKKDWEKALTFIFERKQNDKTYKKLYDLTLQTKDINRKNPVIAGSLSAIVPGTGKIYANDWKDGTVAFLFIGTFAYQAFRGFSKKGIESVYGWTFATIATGFYVGNIYGSAKSAQKHNQTKENEIKNKAFYIIFNAY